MPIYLDHFLITLLALAGFGVCLKLYLLKPKRKFFCFFKHDCSEGMGIYRHFLGLRVEGLGLIYFGFLALLHLYFLIPSLPLPDFLILNTLFLTSVGAFFALYLLFVQGFFLKRFCLLWSIGSILGLLIFGLTLLDLPYQLLPIFQNFKPLFVIIHLFAMVLGLGGATYSDIFFMRFLKNFSIDKREAEILTVISQVIWVGVILAFVSGLALFLADAPRLLESTKFLAKCAMFAILVLNGIAMHAFIIPKLIHISFVDKLRHHLPSFPLRSAAFIMGAISLVSWYSVFILGSLSSLPFTVIQILAFYGLLLIIAVLGSLLFERWMLATAKKQ